MAEPNLVQLEEYRQQLRLAKKENRPIRQLTEYAVHGKIVRTLDFAFDNMPGVPPSVHTQRSMEPGERPW